MKTRQIDLNTGFEYQSCIVCLPCRGGDGTSFALKHQKTGICSVIVGVTPNNHQWYPQPNGPQDQAKAVKGLETARAAIVDVVEGIETKYGITHDRIALVGFSAGAVMAIYTATHDERPFAAIICHGGTILEPENLPIRKSAKEPYLLIHSQDDPVFTWEDRYLPMREALMKQGYSISTIESETGGHRCKVKDSCKFLAKHLKCMF